MATETPRPRNGIGGWILLAAICLGGSTGGGYLGRQTPRNPDITTTAWNEMCRNVDKLQRDVAELKFTVREVLRLVPQQPPQKQP